MFFYQLIEKISRKIWSKIVRFSRHKSFYLKIYRSYWHLKFFGKNRKITTLAPYFTAVPNRGAGIGHQLANWIAGYWYADQLGFKYAHTPFSTEKWESYLGLGEGEISVEDLVKKHGYKKVLLPLFNAENLQEIELIKKIVYSYRGNKIVFIAEQDQYYKDQYGIIEVFKKKFYQAKSRSSDNLIFSSHNFNIAIHVRRGDIVIGKDNKDPNMLMRWQDNKYFLNVLSRVVENIESTRPIFIYLFSQGKKEDFIEFNKFSNIHYCLDMGAQDSFSHMVYSDLLITSKSSFSYKPALLNNGIKICPRNFWHGYPNQREWILVEEDGTFDEKLLSLLSNKKHI